MANGHGGKRTPRKPAAVSGPGKLSRRTDGGPQQVQAEMTGMGYGENKDFMDIQSSAPLAATPGVPSMPATPTATQQPRQQSMQATQLFAPTQRPNEPVTAGAPVGDGPGPVQQPKPSVAMTLEKMVAANPSQEIKDLYTIASYLGW